MANSSSSEDWEEVPKGSNRMLNSSVSPAAAVPETLDRLRPYGTFPETTLPSRVHAVTNSYTAKHGGDKAEQVLLNHPQNSRVTVVEGDSPSFALTGLDGQELRCPIELCKTYDDMKAFMLAELERRGKASEASQALKRGRYCLRDETDELIPELAWTPTLESWKEVREPKIVKLVLKKTVKKRATPPDPLPAPTQASEEWPFFISVGLQRFMLPYQLCSSSSAVHTVLLNVLWRDSTDQDTLDAVGNQRYRFKSVDGAIIPSMFWSTFVKPGMTIKLETWLSPAVQWSGRNEAIEMTLQHLTSRVDAVYYQLLPPPLEIIVPSPPGTDVAVPPPPPPSIVVVPPKRQVSVKSGSPAARDLHASYADAGMSEDDIDEEE